MITNRNDIIQVFGKLKFNNNGQLFFQAFQTKVVSNKNQLIHFQLKTSLLKLINYDVNNDMCANKLTNETKTKLNISNVLLILKCGDYDVNICKQMFNNGSITNIIEICNDMHIDHTNDQEFENFLTNRRKEINTPNKCLKFIPKIILQLNENIHLTGKYKVDENEYIN